MTKFDIIAKLQSRKERSAWRKGVVQYAIDLVYDLPSDFEFVNRGLTRKALLNGDASWQEFSYGGCALFYNFEIAERLCCPSEYRRTKEGQKHPNAKENWLDVQARALYQACEMILNIAFPPPRA